jgi:glutathione S-transferase
MKLYGYRNGRTLRALWALEEIGAAYEYVEVALFRGEARAPWFLELNPAGKVPVLVDGDHVVSESAAICLHLAERYPEAALLPAPGTVDRTDCYKWISYVLTEMDAPLWTIAKHRFALPKEHRVPAVIETATWELGVAAEILGTALRGRPYLAGDAFSVADIIAGHTLLWARSTLPSLPGTALECYLDSLLTRDALQRARSP